MTGFTNQQRQLFHDIVSDIKKHPSAYREAGEWLDTYCTQKSFRKRTLEQRQTLEDDVKRYPLEHELALVNYMLEKDIYISPYDVLLTNDEEVDLERTKKLIDNLWPGSDYLFYWKDAVWSLLHGWERKPILSVEASRRIALMTWIITDPDLDANSSVLEITELEKIDRQKRESLLQSIFLSNPIICQHWIQAVEAAWQVIQPQTTAPTQATSANHKISNWSELSIDFIDDNTVRFKATGKNWVRINCAELGFQDKRKGLPNKLWPIFVTLAKNCDGQIIKCQTPKTVSKDLDRICDKLKMYFGPKDRPICYNKKSKTWKVLFSLTYKSQDSRSP